MGVALKMEPTKENQLHVIFSVSKFAHFDADKDQGELRCIGIRGKISLEEERRPCLFETPTMIYF